MSHLMNRPSQRRAGMRGLKAVVAATLAGSLGLGVAACSSDSSSDNSSSSDAKSASDSSSNAETAQWPRTISTDDGELKLDAQPKRIVSTSTTLTGALLAVGAPVVATGVAAPNTPSLSDDQGFFNQWADEAKKAGVEKLWQNGSPDVEKATEYDADLIVVSKNSGDSVFDQVDKLRKIAPVLVVDYSDASWQDVTTKIGEATGYEAKAKEIIADFDSRLEEVKKNISVPEGTTSPFIVFPDGSGAAALTKESPQSQILSRLGFTLADIPDEVKGDTSMGKDRGDIVKLSMENIQKGLPGDTWISVASNEKTKKTIESEPAFNTSPAVKNGKLYHTPGETFRLDYYSAMLLLDSIEQQFKK
ncbi:Fe2+-enterobactin ABC transporter substrate-binding protein [Corynebacterium sp. 320]|uniref:Fe2+-enterobactin ABC transporter substrate-binding protein n=1 Tax=Corynebacterium zhongnanshanii TaxID=2768834 RepID=A0ABQ6VDF7_9CORY|nr:MULTISPECIES: Fe2+-enterobactin ABC transporter substrate-binding protein [Corynebacterium]KAB1502847.1 Fe2+-enterobactin ABC transporter substrate-binding protein [Corynebacterium sp. 320]KAB1552358.1 Fe2+-enterobactin ABC transporter substrate-binding protein [Corynebacterium sp. 321]KAB1554427.1 Fe2+-enterobactin ABC transporter substrate-binding protein [Corynebacterium sp. 319]KAB3519137.1 Fe2+-enterobactin ABC transporter substrate-binding protein [Corynebacterium zhongnanshanii]KAB35